MHDDASLLFNVFLYMVVYLCVCVCNQLEKISTDWSRADPVQVNLDRFRLISSFAALFIVFLVVVLLSLLELFFGSAAAAAAAAPVIITDHRPSDCQRSVRVGKM